MVGAYLRERVPVQRYGPLAAAIALAVAGRNDGWRTVAVDAGFALLLLVQFRTWDDLADRPSDAVRHPDRVLVRAAQVTQVIAFCGALAVLNLCLAVWRDASGIAVAVLATINGVLGSWYLSRSAGSKDPADQCPAAPGGTQGLRELAGSHLVLAKYPAILIVVAGARALDTPGRTALLALFFYVVVCVYEAWHDPHSALGRRYSLATAKGPR